MRTLAEREAALAQKKAKLARQEAVLRVAARKARDRRIFAMGGLVEKAGLGEVASNVLYGALLDIAHKLDNPSQVELWEKSGGVAFDRERKTRDLPI